MLGALGDSLFQCIRLPGGRHTAQFSRTGRVTMSNIAFLFCLFLSFCRALASNTRESGQAPSALQVQEAPYSGQRQRTERSACAIATCSGH